MTRQILTGLRLLVVPTVVLGVGCPLLAGRVSRVPCRDRAEGSPLVLDGATRERSLVRERVQTLAQHR